MQNDSAYASVAAGSGTAGIDRDLVGEGRQRREDARAAHDDAVRGVADLVQRDLVAGLAARRPWPCRSSGWMMRVGQRDVVAREELLVGDQVRRAALVAVDRPFVGAAGEAGDR